ncbi:MAG TPA: Rieske 2Fe-2S domain-containing protein [Gemmatimonadales bacterium]|jgi:Rieske Fe-S protein
MSECATDCQLHGRRQFLKEATMAVGAVMAALSASPREAAAMPLALVRALRQAGDEVTYPEPGADGVTIDKENEVILVRWKGEMYAFALSCPHQHTALRWQGNDGRFQCPKHKSKYQPDGTFISGKATRNMDRFALRKENKKVIVNVGKLFKSDKQASLWSGARLTV